MNVQLIEKMGSDLSVVINAAEFRLQKEKKSLKIKTKD